MRIAVVTDTYFPRINGVSVSIDTFASEYRKLGHEVYIVAPHFPGHRDHDSRIIRIKSHYLFFDPEDRLPNPLHPSALKVIKKNILSKNFDIIHTQTPFALGIAAIDWARKINCPLVHTYHTLFESYVHYLKFLPKPMSIGIARQVSRWYCNQMDMVVAPTPQIRTLLLKYGVKSPVKVIPTGIKSDSINPEKYRELISRHPELRSTGKKLLYMGRVEKEKNIEMLLEAFREVVTKIDGVRLVIAGGGGHLPAIKKKASEMSLSGDILFTGYFKPEERAEYLNACDIFVFPSVTETQGLVVLEAMRGGLPVVGVNAMGVSEVMKGDAGGILTANNPRDFAEAIMALIRKEKLYLAKKQEALRHSENFSSRNMAVKMLSNFGGLIYRKKMNPNKHKGVLIAGARSININLRRLIDYFRKGWDS